MAAGHVSFSTPKIWVTPLTDLNGNAISSLQSFYLDNIKKLSIDVEASLVSQYGRNRYPIDSATGEGKITGKLTLAEEVLEIFSKMFYGIDATTSAFGIDDNNGDTETIPASTPYTIDITVPNSGTYTEMLSLRKTDGTELTLVTGTPNAGEYKAAFASGTLTLTFNSSDASTEIYREYEYNYTATDPISILVTNTAMGAGPSFLMRYQSTYKGKPRVGKLFMCKATKVSEANDTNNAYFDPEIDFTCFADGNGRVHQPIRG